MSVPQRRLGPIARLTALVSGLVLFAFAAAELCNDAIGLVSLETMGDIAAWRTTFIRSWPGSVLLFVAFVSHVGTTLWFVASRATLRMPLWDAAQIVSGILVPLLLLPYLVDTRLAQALFRRGINVQPILYPAVPERAARLRFFLTAAHSEEQVRQTVAILLEENRQVTAEPSDLAAVARHLGKLAIFSK